ncbi:MAG TPA: sulfatase-like hydrolase/transferase [Thermoguttaceae bacterium]|nr:sulfatase-like hydrolase/transferase [Thermoguttaceae bacterium]
MKRPTHILKTLAIAAVALSAFASTTCAQSPGKQPNILFIFADDQCFDTLNAMGNHEVETPNLDRLVNSGVTFTHAYNMGSWSGAVCLASRAMLNTGRFLWHANRVAKSAEKEREAGRFWSEHLKSAGYETYMTGKWHVSANTEKAFDFVTHVRGGMPQQTPEGYNRPIVGQPDPWSPFDPSFGGYWEGGKHWSEVLGDDATGFLAQAAGHDKPFFMYLAFNAPHDPRQSPKEYVDKYPLDKIAVPKSFMPEYPYNEAMACGRRLRDERLAPFPRTEYSVKVNRQEYYAIITHMDAQVGRILEALDKSGKADETYIFFTADHGLAIGHHGLMGKQNLFDDSIRVPLMVVGPGVPKGERRDGAVYLQDVMASTLELAQLEKPDHVEFRSLMPIIRHEREANYDAVYGAYLAAQRMVIQDNQKLFLIPSIKKALLFDLEKDPLEMNNLAEDPASKPLMKKLFAKLLELQEETGDKMDLKEAYPELL